MSWNFQISRTLRNSALFACFVVIVCTLPVLADTVIYYHKDSDGVFCFTNKPTSSKFKTYMVFRDILSRPGADRGKILALAKKYSRRYGLDEALVQAVIEVESNYEVNAISSAGAEGLMQIMPDTQKDLGVVQPFDPDENIKGGVKYLSSMIERFGTLELALAAYNAGPQNVEKYGGIPPFKETQNYVKKVLARYKAMKSG